VIYHFVTHFLYIALQIEDEQRSLINNEKNQFIPLNLCLIDSIMFGT